MPLFAMFVRLSPENRKNIKESPQRLATARQQWDRLGIKARGIYAIMGRWDFLLVAEAPSEEAIWKALVAFGSATGNTTETHVVKEYKDFSEFLKDLS